MATRPFEMILLRQLAGHLSLPVFLCDTAGTLVFYNEGAEQVLGRRFDETGEMSASEWGSVFVPRDEAGEILPPASLPLSIALSERRPAHLRFEIRGLDGVLRHISTTAIPILALDGSFIGAVAFFWETPT
jgi:PAS domain-containing protein